MLILKDSLKGIKKMDKWETVVSQRSRKGDLNIEGERFMSVLWTYRLGSDL